MLIVMEGTDGSGKKTQTQQLFEYLNGLGNVKKGEFPNYESPSSTMVKMYLNGDFGSNANDMNAYQASEFYAIDRMLTVKKEKWVDFLNDGGILLLDRYMPSNLIHQGGKIDDVNTRYEYCEYQMNHEYNKLMIPKPDLVFFLNVPPAFSIAMAEKRIEYKTGNKADIHESDKNHITNAYNCAMGLAERYGWNSIDCVKDGKLRSIDDIQNEIRLKVDKFLDLNNSKGLIKDRNSDIVSNIEKEIETTDENKLEN